MNKILEIFEQPLTADAATKLFGSRLPPPQSITKTGAQYWVANQLPDMGRLFGFLPKLDKPSCITVFVTKGGVLKTSISFNLARLAALHGVRTCVIGLDMQADISNALDKNSAFVDENTSLQEVLDRVNSIRGLADLYLGDAKVFDLVRPTDIPTLSYIPETPELVALDQALIHRNRREYWLKDVVLPQLYEKFDLVIFDCPPNWNRLITNALVACDLLVSPVECRIHHYRNLSVFRGLIAEFMQDMQVYFKHNFIPTRHNSQRRLSADIFSWYKANLPNCSEFGVRESLLGEEAMAVQQSLFEYAPSQAVTKELRRIILDLWSPLSQQNASNRLPEFQVEAAP